MHCNVSNVGQENIIKAIAHSITPPLITLIKRHFNKHGLLCTVINDTCRAKVSAGGWLIVLKFD